MDLFWAAVFSTCIGMGVAAFLECLHQGFDVEFWELMQGICSYTLVYLLVLPFFVAFPLFAGKQYWYMTVGVIVAGTVVLGLAKGSEQLYWRLKYGKDR